MVDLKDSTGQTTSMSQAEAHELFPFDEGLTGLRIYALLKREGSLIQIEYRIGGERAGEVVLPGPAEAPARKDDLWRSTCFEAFFAEAIHPWYWEANLSPSLDWQLYHFRTYREGGKPEGRVKLIRGERLPENSAGIGYSMVLDASGLFGAKASVDVGITAVIETRDGKQSFWALAHAGSKPDFHLRKSFVLQPT
jgi:hypothetical protein